MTANSLQPLADNVATCDVPRTHTSLGDRSFTAAGPRLWNNLPVCLQNSERTLLEFQIMFKWQPSDYIHVSVMKTLGRLDTWFHYIVVVINFVSMFTGIARRTFC